MYKITKFLKILLITMAAPLALTGCGSEETSLAGNDATEAKHVYLAGPFFNDNEIANIEYAEKILTSRGIEFFSPMRHGVNHGVGL